MAFDVVDFNKFCTQEDFYAFGFSGVRVDYVRCIECGCIFTTFFDGWSPQAFSENIYNADYAKVDGDYAEIRPKSTAGAVARRWGDECRGARLLDYGSGSGVFAGELQRLGFADVTSYDPFSNPVRPSGQFDVITCFEVIEHSVSPARTLLDMHGLLRPDGCIIFSQTFQPQNIGEIRANWWYVGPRNGHVCTFNPNAMACLAQRCGLTFHPGSGPHAFSAETPSAAARSILSKIGPPFYFRPLFAPNAPSVAGWHGIEFAGAQPFRWTASRRLTWPVAPVPRLPATLSFAIPFQQSITPETLQHIGISFGSASGTFRRQGSMLLADLQVTRSSESVSVHIERSMSPRALRGADDDRDLGIAVLVSPERAAGTRD